MKRRAPTPAIVFRLNKKRVVVVGQSERQREQRKQILVKRRKALGALGPRIKASKKKPYLKIHAVPKGAKKKRPIKRIRVLVKARVRGRKAFFTRQLVFPGKRGAKSVKATLPAFLASLEAAYSQRAYPVQVLGLTVYFDKSIRRKAA